MVEMDQPQIKFREVTKWIATCGVCGGPRAGQGGTVCKGCYAKPEIRRDYLNRGATKALPFITLRSETAHIEIKPRIIRARRPRQTPFWDGETIAHNGYWRPTNPGILEALYAKENLWRPGQYPEPVFRAVPKPRAIRVQLAYPFIAKPRDEHAELLAVNSIVPQGIPGREDICQEIMLALWEKRISIDQLRANKSDVRAFVNNFTRANYESGGHAISLDQPMKSGQSWHDVLADPALLDQR